MLHYASQFTNALAKEGYVVKVGIASYYEGDLFQDNISFIKIPSKPSPISFILDSLKFWNHVNFLLSLIRYKPDVVHFIDNHPWYLFYGCIARLCGYAIYTTQHDPILHSGENTGIASTLSRLVNALLRNISQKVIVHGEEIRSTMIESFHLDKNKVISVPHGNYNLFLQWKKEGAPEIDTFLFFWRIIDYKGLDVLLESLDTVKKTIPSYKLIIAGAWNLERYKALIEKNTSNIEIFNKNIPDEEVWRYFTRAEFVVVPYRDATWSGVIPLAYAFSRPVIASRVWALPSAIVEGQTGVTVSPESPIVLGEAIIDFLKRKDTLVEMGIVAKRYADTVLDWQDIAHKIYTTWS
jgi:alpha-maltose-1-phosphate synthase